MIPFTLHYTSGVVGESVVKFNVINLTKPDSLFAMGMRPVLYSHQDAAEKGLGWRRCGHGIDYRRYGMYVDARSIRFLAVIQFLTTVLQCPLLLNAPQCTL